MAKQVTLDELGEMMSYVVENMVTKDDLATELASIRAEMATKDDIKDMATKDDLATGLASVRAEMATKDDIAGIMAELAEIKMRLRELEEIVENHSGYSKDIDYALERIAAIEKHLGIKVARAV